MITCDEGGGSGIVDEGITFDEFGFVVMERIGDACFISVKDADGEEILACELEDNVIVFNRQLTDRAHIAAFSA